MDNAMKGSRHNCFNLHSGSFCLFWSQQNHVTIVVMVMGVFAGMLLRLFFMVMIVVFAATGSHTKSENEQR